MSEIVVVGSINLDLIFPCERIPRPGETLHARTRHVAPGGKGANQAVAAARLGGRVTIVGAVGDDEFAQPALALLRDAGVDLSRVARVDGATGIAIVYVEDGGENSILIEGGANRSMDAAAVRRESGSIAEAAVVVLQGEIPRDGIEAAADLAAGRLIVNLAPVVEVDPAVLRAANPLVVNEHEGVLALRMLTGGRVGSGPVDDRTVVDALRAAGVPSVVMTRGARGALVAESSGVVELASPSVTVVDTTGAGDAFVGALAVGLAAGKSLSDAAAHAVRVGAFACTGRGAQPSYPRATDALPGSWDGGR